MTTRLPLVLACAGLFTACATPPAPPPGDPAPASLRPAVLAKPLMSVHAKGVQVYECRAKGAGAEWVFVAPEAELFDDAGHLVGKHYAGPSWESTDGSKLTGKVAAKADAPEAGSIPWLLLATQPGGTAGVFSKVTFIQRLNTEGGVAPAADGCTAATVGKTEKVGYLADYRMLAQ